MLASLTDVIGEINSLIESPTLNGHQLKIVFGGDYKVHVHVHFIPFVFQIVYKINFPVPPPYNGNECSPLHICLLVVHCVIFRKVVVILCNNFVIRTQCTCS